MKKAVAFIDWISYTRMNDIKKLEYPSEFAGAARAVVWEWQKLLERGDGQQQVVTHVKPNRPFANALMDNYSKSRIEWGGGSDRVLISFSGEGCQFLRSMLREQDLLKTIAGNVTRIDVSVDMQTAITPFEFCKERDKERFKTGAQLYSESGVTQYVGSWSGDRFARVYRYFSPHERAHLLRVEHVFKGRQAKAIAAKLVDTSPSALVASIGEIYGWAHPNWNAAKTSAGGQEEVAWFKAEKMPSKTLNWLQEVACPSIVRMVKEGEILFLEEWLEHNIYDKLSDDGRDTPQSPTKLEG